MLNNIKSKYLLEINILSNLDDKKKLNLIKYSKKQQKNLDVNLIYYKFLSKKYIIFENNKKGKEYNAFNDKLIFEGEYSNKKRNGQGKEYYDDNRVKYEGEFLNGKRWNGKIYSYKNGSEIIQELKEGRGLIKEYYDDGSLKFEGEYLNGERNGNGKKYYKNGNLKFEGEYLNNKKFNGKEYDLNNNIICDLKYGKGFARKFDTEGKLEYEGEYLNGKRSGKWKEFYNDKLIFEGEYLYNYKKCGREFINNYVEYEGEYLYNKKWNGKGYDENHNVIYELINGCGKVKEYNKNNELIFEGEYLNGKRNGMVEEYNCGKLIFEGDYSNGKRNGKGKEYFNGVLIFDGEYLNGKRNGNGKEYIYHKEPLKYGPTYFLLLKRKKYRSIKEDESQITNITDPYLIFEGEFLNGQRWKGIGREFDKFDENIQLKFEGEYLNGEILKGNQFYYEDRRTIVLLEIRNGMKRPKEKIQILDSDYDLVFEGEYSLGKKNGKGFEYFKCGSIKLEANYINDEISGKVKEYYFNGRLKYDGEYLNGKRNGKGEEYNFFRELIFKGEYLNGKRWNGKGKEYSSDDDLGTLIFEGEYVEGKKKEKEK